MFESLSDVVDVRVDKMDRVEVVAIDKKKGLVKVIFDPVCKKIFKWKEGRGKEYKRKREEEGRKGRNANMRKDEREEKRRRKIMERVRKWGRKGGGRGRRDWEIFIF